MKEEWITGGASSPRWSAGQHTAGMPGVTMGPGCRSRVLADEGVRVAFVGDFLLEAGHEQALLRAAAAGRWAELTYLPGSYWVIAQSATHTFVCGDLSGFRSVFHTTRGPQTIWSTSARRLAQHIEAEPDLAMLAARLVAGPEHWPDRTVYEDVRAVPPGFGLLLDGSGTELVDVHGIVPTATLAQGAPAFAQALERSVSWRVRQVAGGPVGADVSGGLDSSTLAILAARDGEVRAVTYADDYTSGEDLLFARRVAAHIDTDLHVGAGGREHLPFGWTAAQPLTDQPAAVSLTTAQQALYLGPAAGLPLHFTGTGGDVVLDSCSAAWIGMVQLGERRAARRQVTGWARARNRSPRELWSAVTEAAGSGHADALRAAARRTARGDFDSRRSGVWSWCHLGQSGRWLTAEGRERVSALLLQAAATTDADARADLTEQRFSLRLIGADARDTVPLTAPWNIHQVHPFLDNEVVRAAFAIAPPERHGVTSFKPLLPAALPYLPAWLTGRTSKGSFTRQLTAGMIHHRAALSETIRSSALTAAGLLDAELALAALAAVDGTQAGSLYDLQRLAMTCQWLAAGEHRPLEAAC
ncbi:asparagine synthase-related protein [Streptomyces sp. NPDC088915]|uniref:asparagine synthase-related protein n=1 Tax=Streptomyces sp. NPDC088915 TaxID=3365912 RepID=UPI00381411CA